VHFIEVEVLGLAKFLKPPLNIPKWSVERSKDVVPRNVPQWHVQAAVTWQVRQGTAKDFSGSVHSWPRPQGPVFFKYRLSSVFGRIQVQYQFGTLVSCTSTTRG
jgi:hypothetical protein